MEISTNGYTKAEIRLISMFGYGDLVSRIECPPGLYRMCVEKAFVEKMEGPHVEALRRAYLALMRCSPYRQTEEFEKLVSF